MLENRWARDYLKGLFEASRTPDDLQKLVAASGLQDIEDPLLEIGFLRHGRSAIKGFNLGIAALALCGEDAPIALVADLIEHVEACNWKLVNAAAELPGLRQAVNEDPTMARKLPGWASA
jgi:hypothetical protein